MLTRDLHPKSSDNPGTCLDLRRELGLLAAVERLLQHLLHLEVDQVQLLGQLPRQRSLQQAERPVNRLRPSPSVARPQRTLADRGGPMTTQLTASGAASGFSFMNWNGRRSVSMTTRRHDRARLEHVGSEQLAVLLAAEVHHILAPQHREAVHIVCNETEQGQKKGD